MIPNDAWPEGYQEHFVAINSDGAPEGRFFRARWVEVLGGKFELRIESVVSKEFGNRPGKLTVRPDPRIAELEAERDRLKARVSELEARLAGRITDPTFAEVLARKAVSRANRGTP